MLSSEPTDDIKTEENTMKRNENEITINPIKVKHAHIFIEGDSDLVLNKMNARNERTLLAEDRKKIREKPNPWEDVITAIHWRDPLNMKDTYTECDEAAMHRLLTENAPCITAFGLKKSIGDAVVRNEIDQYKTKLENAINIIATRGLIPITFAEWSLDERLMAPKKGAPVTVRLSHFSGWKADFQLDYTDHVYSLEQLVNFIDMAGFGLGIGSGRTSGYGRYHVVDVK